MLNLDRKSKTTVKVSTPLRKKSQNHKRLAIYAAYNGKGKIDNADISYLMALTEIADDIIYVADNELLAHEEEKILGLVSHIEAERHGEYDFGSYKRGFEYAIKHNLLAHIDELIFCNSSCYAPIHSFMQMFNTMKQHHCDFWGMTEKHHPFHHIQSFFLVFRPTVFNSNVFIKFIRDITKQPNVQAIISKYEFGLSYALHQAGFNSKAYIPFPSENICSHVKHLTNLPEAPVWLMQQGAPLLKKKIFTIQLKTIDSLMQTWQIALHYNPSLRECLPPPYKFVLKKLFSFIYKKKITQHQKTLIRICGIPIYKSA